MRPTFAIAPVFVVAALALVGCGGSGGSDDSADKESITVLVGELNRVTADRDAAGFCDVMQPSGVKANFKSRSRCISETTQILKQAGRQPVLNIDEIDVNGDTATVKLEGSVGELNLAREGGNWYVAFSDTSPDSADSGSTGSAATGTTDPGDSGDTSGNGETGSDGG
jgi:hypothetical protein